MIGLQTRGARETADRLGRARQAFDRRARAAVQLMLMLARQKLVRRMSNQSAGRDPFWGVRSPAGAFLRARSGITRQRLSAPHVFKRGDHYEGAVGSPDRHVLLHEHGGTVSGTSPRGYLRIPTAAAQTLAGVDRFAGKSIRDIPEAFLIRLRTGSLWAVRIASGAGPAREGPRGGARLEFLYLLKRSVTHRPRGIFAAVAREMTAEFARIGATEMQAVVATANGAAP